MRQGIHPGHQAFTEEVGAFHDEHGPGVGGTGRGWGIWRAKDGFVGRWIDPLH
jgi:hypothetical protein